MRLALLSIIILLIPSICSPESTKQEYQKVQERLEISQDKLKSAQKKEIEAKKDLTSLDKDIQHLNQSIQVQKSQIEHYKKNISETKAQLNSISNSLSERKSHLEAKIKILQRFADSIDRTIILLSAEDFYKMQRVNRYLSIAVQRQFREIRDFNRAFSGLRTAEASVRENLNSQNREYSKLKKTIDSLEQAKREKEVILLASRREQQAHQDEIQRLKAASERLKEITRESEKETAVSSTGFKKEKGRLRWPVEGEIAVPYGASTDPRYKSTVFRQGIFFHTANNAQVRAIHDGKVVFADQFKGLGNVIIVNHGGGYHSVYANLGKMNLKSGDNVNENDIIGTAGVPGQIDEPGIYFEVRYKGKPIDPSRWLSQRR